MKDFEGEIIPITPEIIQRTRNAHVGHVMLSLPKLKEALEAGRLSGRLKEIVSVSSEEDNDILMLLHFKH